MPISSTELEHIKVGSIVIASEDGPWGGGIAIVTSMNLRDWPDIKVVSIIWTTPAGYKNTGEVDEFYLDHLSEEFSFYI